jgi:hypothetical protein
MPPRGRNSFKLCDLQRALRAAKQAGVAVDVEITDGKMTVVTKQQPGESPVTAGKNPWDKVLKNAPDKKRTA